jgi:hypothetical protein
MSLDEDLADVASRHAQELRSRIDRDRHLLEERRAETAEIERRLAAEEWLLESSAEPSPVRDTLRLSGHGAMAEVLRTAPQYKMRPVDLAAEINRRDLYRMRDGRPIETQQIHARVGNYPDMFERDGAFIKLKEGWRPRTPKTYQPRTRIDFEALAAEYDV